MATNYTTYGITDGEPLIGEFFTSDPAAAALLHLRFAHNLGVDAHAFYRIDVSDENGSWSSFVPRPAPHGRGGSQALIRLEVSPDLLGRQAGGFEVMMAARHHA